MKTTTIFGEMQPLHEDGLEMEILDVDGDFDGINEHYVIEMHLENLQKQKLA
jgi:hypothetical protein